MIHFKKDNHQIVTLTLDKSNSAVNIINHELAKAFIPVVEQLEKEKAQGSIRGVIITSAKPTFLAGGDLDYLYQATDPEEIFQFTEGLQDVFRRLELVGVPVVAALNGAALGTGYELALSCHYRVALDKPSTVIGLPEVTLGMMPASGGLTRLLWMLGLEQAYTIAAEGRRYHVKEALKLGLIDAIVEEEHDLLTHAKNWILNQSDIVRLWDASSIPNESNPKIPTTAARIARMTASLVKKSYGNYPARQAILNTLVEAAYLDFDIAQRIEGRYFAQLVCSPTAKNMTKAFWFDLNKIKHGQNRPRGFGRFRARRIGIIGAGKMGSGIAYLAAMVGIEVILKDVSLPVAAQGKAFSGSLLNRLVQLERMTEAQRDEILARIHPTAYNSDFEDCDLIIESVFENLNLKSRVVREVEMHIHHEAFMASNTSTLTIGEIAQHNIYPDRFIGLHFLSPVLKMSLVEVVCSNQTSQETIARAFDFVNQIRKVPIIVQDTPGFFATRVLKSFLFEGMALLDEGQMPAAIEHAARQAGMPMGPLELTDELSLETVLRIHEEMQKGALIRPANGKEVLERMLHELKRPGKQRNAGFYEYERSPSRLWGGLREHFPANPAQITAQDMMDRLLFIQCIEALHCLEEGVIQTEAAANVASIQGWGFAPFTGGSLQFIRNYGIEAFTQRAQDLETRYGARFALPDLKTLLKL